MGTRKSPPTAAPKKPQNRMKPSDARMRKRVSSSRAACFGRPKLHTDLEPPVVIASEARRSIVEKNGFMDCHTTFAMTDGSWRAQRGNPGFVDCHAALAMTKIFRLI